MKRLLAVIVILIALAIPTAVFAHTQDVSTTQFYACEDNATHQVDPSSITQDDTLDCTKEQSPSTLVTWSVTGPQGIQGDPGTQGPQGDTGVQGPKGETGPAGIPFSHAPCTETLTGSEQQENMVFCISGIEPDGGIAYQAAIGAAASHLMVGTPISQAASVDWGGQAITYIEFTSDFHMEYHADNVVRVYNLFNRQVYP